MRSAALPSFAVRNTWDPARQIPTSLKSWSVSFPSSQLECLDQLKRIKYNLRRHQDSVRTHIDDYHQLMIRQLDEEYRQLRAEITLFLDKAYDTSKFRVKQHLGRSGVTQLERVFGEIAGLNQRIEELIDQLEAGDAIYKQGISETVVEDFEKRRLDIVGMTKQSVEMYQRRGMMAVNEGAYNSIKDAISTLFILKLDKNSQMEQTDLTYDRQPQPNFNITLTPPLQSPYALQPQYEPPIVPRLSIPSHNSQSFSFQPSKKSSERTIKNLHVPTTNSDLRESSAQQFNNLFARQFQSEYKPEVGYSNRGSTSKDSVPQMDLRRNRDILRSK